MKILVLVKEILDIEADIGLRDHQTLEVRDGRYIINPYDELALEEALRLKEQCGGEVVAISLGRPETENTIRHALALGADRASLIIADSKDGGTVSSLLAGNINREEDYALILAGWIAPDDNQAQIPGRISRILGLPLVNAAVKIDILDQKAICVKEGEGFFERVEVPLPAIITVQKGINQPRFPTVMSILQAIRTPLKKFTADSLRLPSKDVTYELPARQRKGVIMKGTNPDEAAAFLIRAILAEKVC